MIRSVEEFNSKIKSVMITEEQIKEKIAEAANGLREDTEQQAIAIEQADAGIERISEVVQSNSAAAEESSATSQELSASATSMNELVGRFQLKHW